MGCGGCDTDYRTKDRHTPGRLGEMVREAFPRSITGRSRWVWITGGEPTDQNLGPLVDVLYTKGISVAVATSGVRPLLPPVDWLSVSPHRVEDLGQLYGNEIKLVPGLNGLDAEEFIRRNDSGTQTLGYWFRFLQPLYGSEDSINECIRLWEKYPRWGISTQTHKILGLD